MENIRVGFWNVDNLFDTFESSIGANIEFTPPRGWNSIVKNKKIENLSSIINSMYDDQGPDLLGLCEIENEKIVFDLIEKMNRADEYSIASYIEGPDIRGIDTCLIYSKMTLKLNYVRNYGVNLRYPTRDIFVANFTVLENNADLTVMINHWPSRGGGQLETEPFRILAAETCARAVEDVLKISIEELSKLPFNLKNDPSSLNILNNKWNKNILIMGDFNDNPFDRSILNYLNATYDMKKLLNWKEIFEHPFLKKWPTNRQSDKHNYLFYQSYLFNCMWSLLPDGTLFYEDGCDLFDQFICSKGLIEGQQHLKIDLTKTKINKKIQLEKNMPGDAFDILNRKKIHPIYKQAPMKYEYQKIKPNGELEEIFPGRKILTGYSDHFPIESVINIIK